MTLRITCTFTMGETEAIELLDARGTLEEVTEGVREEDRLDKIMSAVKDLINSKEYDFENLVGYAGPGELKITAEDA